MRNFYRPRRPYQQQKQRKFYTINYRIEAPTLRVIDSQGKQIGILSKEEAQRLAQEAGLDLVLIAPKSQPPIAKIIDFKKFLYREEKKQKEAKHGIKKSIVKDLKLSLFIGPADFDRLVNKGQKFLNDGNQLRINLPLQGREIGKKSMAFELINKFINSLGQVNISKEAKLEGRIIRTVVARKK